MKYTYEVSSDMWECGDGCCTMWEDKYRLMDPTGKVVGEFDNYDRMIEFLLTHAGIELESV